MRPARALEWREFDAQRAADGRPPAGTVAPDWLASRLGDEHLRVVFVTPAVRLTRVRGGAKGQDPTTRVRYRGGSRSLFIPTASALQPGPWSLKDADLGPVTALLLADAMSRLGVGDGHQVIAYDTEGGGAATRLVSLLRRVGHEDAFALEGGLAAWRAAGLPVVVSAALFAPTTFTVRLPPL